jgi:hypothetical protein
LHRALADRAAISFISFVAAARTSMCEYPVLQALVIGAAGE